MNWYKIAEEQLDLFESNEPEKSEDPTPVPPKNDISARLHVSRPFYKESGAYFVNLVKMSDPPIYYEYQVRPDAKWVDNPRYEWYYPILKIAKKNPNGLWGYVEGIAITCSEVYANGGFIREVPVK